MAPRILLAFLCLCPLKAVADSSADETPHYLELESSLGYHYSSGDYGNSKKTQISYVPLILRGDIDAWSVELTLPYISIRGPRGIFGVVDGTTDDADNSVKRESGPGDILLSAAYTLWPWWESMPFLTATGRVKFPTASENDGLGTGAFDFYVSGQAVWTLGPFTPFVEVGYEALGDAPDINLRDAGRVIGGLSYQAAEALYLGISLDYGSPTSSSAGQRIDLVPFVTWNITDSMTLATYASAGLASGSPDVGVGVQLGYDLYRSGE